MANAHIEAFYLSALKDFARLAGDTGIFALENPVRIGPPDLSVIHIFVCYQVLSGYVAVSGFGNSFKTLDLYM